MKIITIFVNIINNCIKFCQLISFYYMKFISKVEFFNLMSYNEAGHTTITS
ncbi:hypothetical protein BSNK01_08520 [Bacillaceae bacterium]